MCAPAKTACAASAQIAVSVVLETAYADWDKHGPALAELWAQGVAKLAIGVSTQVFEVRGPMTAVFVRLDGLIAARASKVRAHRAEQSRVIAQP